MTELSVWSVLVSNAPLRGEEGRTQVTIGIKNGMQSWPCMQGNVLHKLTFTNCCFSIKNTSSAATISSASPCVVTNQNKPSVTTVVSHGIESIVAVFIRSRTTVCHKAIGIGAVKGGQVIAMVK